MGSYIIVTMGILVSLPLIDIPCRLKFRFLPSFYKKQSEFNNFPKNKLTGTVFLENFIKFVYFLSSLSWVSQ